MQCKKNEYVEGNIFHFYNRTPRNKLLFHETDDYIYLLKVFKKNLNSIPCDVLAYCLMPNHFHFCLLQKGNIPSYRIFNRTIMSYAMHYNSKYNIQGKLFESKLQSKRIAKDTYLLQVIRYIHYNPVKAGIVKDINDWPYSNYLEYVNKRSGSLQSAILKEFFPFEMDNYAKTLTDYEQYLDEVSTKGYLLD